MGPNGFAVLVISFHIASESKDCLVQCSKAKMWSAEFEGAFLGESQ